MNPIFPLEQWHEARVSRDVAQLSSQPAPLLSLLFRSTPLLCKREKEGGEGCLDAYLPRTIIVARWKENSTVARSRDAVDCKVMDRRLLRLDGRERLVLKVLG